MADLSLAAHGRPGPEGKKLWILQPTWCPSSQNNRKGQKQSPNPLFLWHPGRQQNSPNRFQVTRRLIIYLFIYFSFFFVSPSFYFFFFPRSETIKLGVRKCPGTDQKGEQEANLKNWETKTNVTLLSHRAGMLLFICIIILSLFLPLLFYFIFLFLFLMFSFPCISRLNCIV